MPVKLALAALAVGATGLGVLWWMALPESTTAAFVCPETQPQTTGMSLKETPADVARASSALSGPESEAAIRAIAADLMRRYPEADSADLVNYLMTAYCPLLENKTWLSNQEKRALMNEFSTQAYRIVNAFISQREVDNVGK